MADVTPQPQALRPEPTTAAAAMTHALHAMCQATTDAPLWACDDKPEHRSTADVVVAALRSHGWELVRKEDALRSGTDSNGLPLHTKRPVSDTDRFICDECSYAAHDYVEWPCRSAAPGGWELVRTKDLDALLDASKNSGYYSIDAARAAVVEGREKP